MEDEVDGGAAAGDDGVIQDIDQLLLDLLCLIFSFCMYNDVASS